MVDVENALVDDEVLHVAVEVVLENIDQTGVSYRGVDEPLVDVQVGNIELLINYDGSILLLGVVDLQDADVMAIGIDHEGEHRDVLHIDCGFEEGLEDDLLLELHSIDCLAHYSFSIVLAVLDGKLAIGLVQSEILGQSIRRTGEPVHREGSVVRFNVDLVDVL